MKFIQAIKNTVNAKSNHIEALYRKADVKTAYTG